MSIASKKKKSMMRKKTMAQVIWKKSFPGNLGDNLQYREQCSKDSIDGDNVHLHNYEDDEICINQIREKCFMINEF